MISSDESLGVRRTPHCRKILAGEYTRPCSEGSDSSIEHCGSDATTMESISSGNVPFAAKLAARADSSRIRCARPKPAEVARGMKRLSLIPKPSKINCRKLSPCVQFKTNAERLTNGKKKRSQSQATD